MDKFNRYIKPYWKALFTILFPLVLIPLPVISATAQARCAYVIIIMASFWMLETMPLAITALIPIFAFPLLGIVSTGELCGLYMTETNMMFFGGLAVATAVEFCGLHRRIALFVILNVGQSPKMLMFGFMMTTMFLSMWISNTASTAMMVPIVDAILHELFKKKNDANVIEGENISASDDIAIRGNEGETRPENNTTVPSTEKEIHESDEVKLEESDELSDDAKILRVALLLGVAYSANIGGTGVLTGTTPNLILKADLDKFFGEESGLNFATWMGFNIPGMLICVVLAYFWLQVLFMGFICKCKGNAIIVSTRENELNVKRLIQRKYNALGNITFHEAVVLSLFIVLVFLWLFRAPGFVPGWSQWIKDAFGDNIIVDDATPAILIVFLLMVIPRELNFWFFNNKDVDGTMLPKSTPACLTWQILHEKIPWGVILLLGGGFAMAEATERSGLSVWLGDQLSALEVLPVELTVFLISLMITMLTEVTSNTATASIFMPVLRTMSLSIKVHPLYLMLPATVCCSYAFMLPVATPPNAIVFEAANMKTSQMMKAGLLMNVICVIVVNLMINTLGVAMFDVKHLPDWANITVSHF